MWSAIKNLVGSSSKAVFNYAEVDGIILQRTGLASAVNNAFIAATKSLPPLSEYEKIHLVFPTPSLTLLLNPI